MDTTKRPRRTKEKYVVRQRCMFAEGTKSPFFNVKICQQFQVKAKFVSTEVQDRELRANLNASFLQGR